MAEIEESSGGDIPEWVVTFGDMMSLLLTFFIMLVSMSEIKEEERYQALVESMRQQFGHDMASISATPGKYKPRNSSISKLATQGRAKRLDVMRGGDKVEAPVGDNSRVRIVRPGIKTAVGTVIYFEDNSAELTDEHKADLAREAVVLSGKPQKIEVRGHTSLRPPGPKSEYGDNWDLSYDRCRNTMRYLVDELGIDGKRIRMSVAGANEPVHIGADPGKLKLNPRVEVFVLDEVVSDLPGTAEELEKRFVDDDETP